MTDLIDERGHPTRSALDRVLTLFHEQLDSAEASPRDEVFLD